MVSFKEWWTKPSQACHFLGVTLMTWSFLARHHRSMWGIYKPFLNGCGGGNCTWTIENASFSMTDKDIWVILSSQMFLGCNKLKWTFCKRFRHWSICRDFVFSWAWRITTIDLSRTLASSPSFSPISWTRTNLGLRVVSSTRPSRHSSKNWVGPQCFNVRMSSNPSRYIRTGVHWVWKQFSFKMMTLADSILLLMLHKATTLWRPIICPMKIKTLTTVWDIAHFQPYLYNQLFTLITNHQPLRWLMKSNKFTSKLAMWILLLQDYDFEVIHHARNINLDANGLSCNLSPLDEDLTRARWHGNCDREVVSIWHAVAYLTLFYGSIVEVQIQGSDDDTDPPQAITDIWEDLPVLHKLQQKNISLIYFSDEKE